MDTGSVISEIMAHNSADLEPIIAQCGGLMPFMSLLPHLQAIVETSNAAPDPATAVFNVVRHNEQSVRTVYKFMGGLDGLVKLMPNLVNIYRTVAKTQHPLVTLLQHVEPRHLS